MVKQLSMGPMRLWYDTVDPGLSETNVEIFNWWLNTSSGHYFMCLDDTIGTQAWQQVVSQGDNFSFGSLLSSAGGSLRTNTGSGNTLLLQAYDVDGAVYTTFATLTAGNTPTLNLSDAVTKADQYIYRSAGTDISITDGGTGASDVATARDNLGLGSGIPSAGQILIGNGTDFSTASLTAGPGISSTAGSGTLTISSNTGGSVSEVNLKNTGPVSIFTTPIGSTFIPQSLSVIISASDTFVSAATLSVGTNSASYNNILAATALTGLSVVGACLTIPISSLSTAVSAGTQIFVNITIGATATTLSGTIKLNGFYI